MTVPGLSDRGGDGPIHSPQGISLWGRRNKRGQLEAMCAPPGAQHHKRILSESLYICMKQGQFQVILVKQVDMTGQETGESKHALYCEHTVLKIYLIHIIHTHTVNGE